MEFVSAAQRRVHLVRVVEQAVVHVVREFLLTVGNQRLEPVSPQYLRRQVRGARLRRLARRLGGAFHQYDDLETFMDQIGRRHVVQWTGAVDNVHHHHRPDHEQVGIVIVRLHL